MRLARDNNRTRLSKASVVTIGNFDGLHLGHRVLINRCRELAGTNRETALVTFEPQPQALFAPECAPPRLTSVRQKLELLAKSGMDLVWMMRFNRGLADMPAHDFVQHVLVSGLSARHVVVGEDFRFGKSRAGDLEFLRDLGTESGFEVAVIPAVVDDGVKISSTLIREALAAGDLARANHLLGREFSMQGRVLQGVRLGRTLGYPTANMRPASLPSPLAGVFAVRTRILENGGAGDWLDGVASLGRRPAVGGKEFLVEVHVFDFDEEIYGQRLDVRFVRKLRDEANFENLDALVDQMHKDAAQARDALLEDP